MEILDIWRSLYTLRYVPITLFVQVIFWAGKVYTCSAVRASSGVRMANIEFRHSLSQAKLCVQYLNEAGESFQCAKVVAGILDNLLEEELGELKTKDTDKPGIDAGSTISVAPGPSSAGDHDPGGNAQRHLGYTMEPSSSQQQFPNPQMAPMWAVWKPNDIARYPVEGGMPSWPGHIPPTGAVQESFGVLGSPFNPPIGMGLGMRGGDTLSSRPFSPTQMYTDRQTQPIYRNNVDPGFVRVLQQMNTAGPNVFI
jgi:hypothetical protein